MPSSTARRASAAYSSGVYGIAGHCSRLAIAPEIEQDDNYGVLEPLMLHHLAGNSDEVAVYTHTARLPSR